MTVQVIKQSTHVVRARTQAAAEVQAREAAAAEHKVSPHEVQCLTTSFEKEN